MLRKSNLLTNIASLLKEYVIHYNPVSFYALHFIAFTKKLFYFAFLNLEYDKIDMLTFYTILLILRYLSFFTLSFIHLEEILLFVLIVINIV
jgi:hypothetical protein